MSEAYLVAKYEIASELGPTHRQNNRTKIKSCITHQSTQDYISNSPGAKAVSTMGRLCIHQFSMYGSKVNSALNKTVTGQGSSPESRFASTKFNQKLLDFFF